MSFRRSCERIKNTFGGKFDMFFDAGCGRPGQEAYQIKALMEDVTIYGFEASTPRYEDLVPTYPGHIYNVMLGDRKQTYSGFLGGANVCGQEVDSFRINITEEEQAFVAADFKPASIDCITLDDFYKENKLEGDVFIWADIEGAELSMLKGATWLLENRKIAGLNLEISNVEWFPRPAEVLDFLLLYGCVPMELVKVRQGGHKDILFRRVDKG